jgi:hypothetical protein
MHHRLSSIGIRYIIKPRKNGGSFYKREFIPVPGIVDAYNLEMNTRYLWVDPICTAPAD